mmetsp:Transcript_32433/g.63397  ORF Transcript_32433/g.63397 Transcript_32433/m.63397 type:complete len:297 (-) Transcript_32433:254-1144(-)
MTEATFESMSTDVRALFAVYDQKDVSYVVGPSLFFLALAIQKNPKKRVFGTFIRELVGMAFMICCVFPPGPALGPLGWAAEWAAHMLGVIVSDRVMGGPYVNPAVTFSMYCWKQVTLLEALSIISAQLLGAIIGFPFAQLIIQPLGATLGGPSVDSALPMEQGFANEFAGFMILMCAVYGCCFTPLGDYYLLKQSLVAASIRFVLVFYPVTGPAINPALGSIWSFYSTGTLPRTLNHYVVYWLGPCLAGCAITLLWSGATRTGIFEKKPGDAPAKSTAAQSDGGRPTSTINGPEGK